MRRRWHWLCALLLLLAVGCQGDGSVEVPWEKPEPGPPRISVAALPDDRFKLTTRPIPPGPTRFAFTNVDEQRHEMALFRLKEGVELTETLVTGNRAAFAARNLGRIPPLPLDGTGEIVRDVTPGSYAVICYLRAPDGKPYAAHGMFEQFEVERGAKLD